MRLVSERHSPSTWALSRKRSVLVTRTWTSLSGTKGHEIRYTQRKSTKEQESVPSYKKFGVSSIDAFNRSAVLLIGKFQFIDSIVDKFYVDTRRLLKTDLRKVRLVEIDEKLRVKAFKKTRMAQFTDVQRAVKGVLGGFSGVLKGIKRLHSDSIRLLKNAPKELSNRRKAVPRTLS